MSVPSGTGRWIATFAINQNCTVCFVLILILSKPIANTFQPFTRRLVLNGIMQIANDCMEAPLGSVDISFKLESRHEEFFYDFFLILLNDAVDEKYAENNRKYAAGTSLGGDCGVSP